jgi:hypothetical protein
MIVPRRVGVTGQSLRGDVAGIADRQDAVLVDPQVGVVDAVVVVRRHS